MSDTLTPVEMYAELRTAIATEGSEAAFARKHRLSRQEVNDATTRRRPPNASVVAALGLMPVVRYIRRKQG